MKHCFILFGLASFSLLSACSGESTAKTAPSMSVEPQANYTSNGQLDTTKYQSIQSGYVAQGGN